MRYFIASVVAICALWWLTACDDNSPDDGMPLYFSALWLNGRLLRIYDLLLISFADL